MSHAGASLDSLDDITAILNPLRCHGDVMVMSRGVARAGASLDSLDGITRALDAQVQQIDTIVNDAEAAERRHADDVLGAATCAQLRVFLASLEQPWAPPGGIDAHSWSRDELRAWCAARQLPLCEVAAALHRIPFFPTPHHSTVPLRGGGGIALHPILPLHSTAQYLCEVAALHCIPLFHSTPQHTVPTVHSNPILHSIPTMQ